MEQNSNVYKTGYHQKPTTSRERALEIIYEGINKDNIVELIKSGMVGKADFESFEDGIMLHTGVNGMCDIHIKVKLEYAYDFYPG